MIRRWSCVIQLNNNFTFYKPFFKHYKITTFKSSVNFKRFSFKFTKFKRKSLIRLKHRSNFLIYTNVIKLWVKDYIFNKNYLRMQFLNKIFIMNFYFYNFNFIRNKNDNFINNFNFIFSTFNNKNYFYYYKNNIKNLKNSSLTLAFYLNKPFLNETIVPVFFKDNNILFSYHTNKDSLVHDFLSNFDFLFSLTLNKILEIKKIITIFFYINIFKRVK